MLLLRLLLKIWLFLLQLSSSLSKMSVRPGQRKVLLTCCLLGFLFLSPGLISAENVVFGKTGAGKSLLINLSCDLKVPVGETTSIESTSDKVVSLPCLGTRVVDTVGLFDYTKDGKRITFSVAEVLTMILLHVQQHGISSLIWVWPTWDPKGNEDLEAIFKALRKLLPEVDSVIVENQWQVKGVVLESGVPKHLSEKYKLPLISVSPNNVNDLKAWIEKHQRKVQVVLPANWEDLIAKFDYETLRKRLLEASLLSCKAVTDQLDSLTKQMRSLNSHSLQEQCQGCNVPCVISSKKCCATMGFEAFGFGLSWCSKYCVDSQPDPACITAVGACRESCTRGLTDIADKFQAVNTALSQQWSAIKAQNQALLDTCDRYDLANN